MTAALALAAATLGIGDDAVDWPRPSGRRFQFRAAAKQRKKSKRRAKAKAARKARKQQRHRP